jgi:hypothetical protein
MNTDMDYKQYTPGLRDSASPTHTPPAPPPNPRATAVDVLVRVGYRDAIARLRAPVILSYHIILPMVLSWPLFEFWN